MKIKFSDPKFIEIKYRNFKKYNHEALIIDLENAIWPDCSNLNFNEAVEQFTCTLTSMGFAVCVRSVGQKYGPTCHQRDRADVTEFVTLVRLSSLGQHVGVLALAGYKRRKSALTAGPIVNKRFPQISKRVKRVTQPGWITADILKCMKLRDGCKRRGKHKEYKVLTNLTLKLIKDAKARYYNKNMLKLTSITLISWLNCLMSFQANVKTTV